MSRTSAFHQLSQRKITFTDTDLLVFPDHAHYFLHDFNDLKKTAGNASFR